MSNESSKSSPLHCEVTYPRPDVALAVRYEVSYSSTATDGRLMDIYAPSEDAAPRAAIVIASGYPAAGLRHYAGCSPRALASITSWAQLLASEGLAAITYDAVEPTTDVRSVLALLRRKMHDWASTRIGWEFLRARAMHPSLLRQSPPAACKVPSCSIRFRWMDRIAAPWKRHRGSSALRIRARS